MSTTELRMTTSELHAAIAAHRASNNAWETTQALLNALIHQMRSGEGGITRQEFVGRDFKVVFTLKKQKP